MDLIYFTLISSRCTVKLDYDKCKDCGAMKYLHRNSQCYKCFENEKKAKELLEQANERRNTIPRLENLELVDEIITLDSDSE